MDPEDILVDIAECPVGPHDTVPIISRDDYPEQQMTLVLVMCREHRRVLNMDGPVQIKERIPLSELPARGLEWVA